MEHEGLDIDINIQGLLMGSLLRAIPFKNGERARTPFFNMGVSKMPFFVYGVSKIPFFVVGLKNATFCTWYFYNYN